MSPGIKVAKTPWSILRLDKAHKDEWRPILKELVSLQRRSISRNTFTAHGSASSSVTVTVPVSLPSGLSWNDLLDKVLSKREVDGRDGAGTPYKKPRVPTGRKA